jgi:hypothetical protein
MTSSTMPPPAPISALKFTGENGVFRRLVTKGAALELVTLGFYRFWLATRIRAHLWAHTLIDGDPLEYLGTGRELMIGFLFAIAILAPVYLVYFLAGLEAERIQAFASTPLAIFYYGFLQFAIYRGRRYRLNRTIWRGLRFGMDGSGIVYALKSMAWGLAAMFSFGLAWPWRQAALERQKMKHTFYGGLRGEFTGTGGGLMKALWPFYVAAILAVVALGVSIARVAEKSASPILTAGIVLVLLVCFPFAFAAFRAREWKWWIDGMRLGLIAAQSRLGHNDLMRYYWAIVGFLLLAAAFASATAGGVLALSGDALKALGKGPPPALAIAGVAVVYIAFFLAFTAVVRIYTIQRIWKTIVGSTVLTGLDRAGEVFAREDHVTALGEGIADGFDIMGF